MNEQLIYNLNIGALAITTLIVLFMVIRRNLMSFNETLEHKMHVWIGVVFVLTMIFVHLTDKNNLNNSNKFLVYQYIFSIFVQILFIIHFIKRINK